MTAQTCFTDEITVDGFCGGGGWSTGFELATGRPVDIGINHDASAIALHKKNHPYTRHYNENIWEVDPRTACAGRPVGWAHFSPDCKHFSRAKGAKPVSKKIRGLAWVVLKWAGTVYPRIISMENGGRIKPDERGGFDGGDPARRSRDGDGKIAAPVGPVTGQRDFAQQNGGRIKPDERGQAMQLHSDIMANMRAAATAMVEFCRQLKEMRDRKLYSALGFARFEDYAEQAVGIKWRQAYNYIQVYERLSPQLLEQNAGLGVTKLLLLTQVSAPDRAEFAGENDLAGMTVEEIKALISEKNGLAQQISMLETEKADAENSETFLKKEVARLQAESREKDELLEKLRQEPVETCAEEGGDAEQCVDLDAVRAQAAMTARAEAQKQAEAEKAEAVRAARADEREKAKKAAEKAQADAVKKAEDAAAARAKAQAEQERAELENAAKQAEERAHELEKRLEIAGDQDTLRFSLLFEGIQRDMNTALGLLNSMRGKGNTDKADKLGSAMAQLLGQAAELARGE